MAYYLSRERREDPIGAYQRYQDYLRENQRKLPSGAIALGTAEWWQNPEEHKCPHDAWLVSVSVSEPASGERSELRHTAIRVRLFGAYHDGHIELTYPQVFRYSLDAPAAARGLGDWLCDEFTLSASGRMVHEIEWAGFQGDDGARWVIEASDIEFQWIPK